MGETLADRVRRRIEDLGTTPRAVSLKVTGKPDFLRPILAGAHPRADNLMALAAALQTSVSWLLTGEHEHIDSADVASRMTSRNPTEPRGASTLGAYEGTLPGSTPEIDARAGAGDGQVGEHDVVNLGRGEAYIGHRVVSEWVFPSQFLRHELRTNPGAIVLLEVIGDSMSPTLESGDRVLVDTNHNRPTPDGVYVIDEGDGPMVKRLQLVRRSEPLEIRVISDNPRQETYTMRLEDIRVIGRVAARIAKM